MIRRADGQIGPSVLEHHAGGHGGQRRLPPLDAVGAPIGQSLAGECARLGAEVGHGVVEHKAAAVHHDPAAEPVPYSLGLGDRVPKAVHHCKVRGVSWVLLGLDPLRRSVFPRRLR